MSSERTHNIPCQTDEKGHSQNLNMHNDDDIQLRKENLSRQEERNRACADDTSHMDHESLENDKPPEVNAEAYDSDSDSDPPSGVHLGYYDATDDDEADSDDEGCRLDAAYSYSEWGVDEPEFEGYPAFSDEEEAFGQDDWSDEADYGDDGDGRYDGYDGVNW
ncbi:hypothetical protein BDV10DRAFT_181286 [Aspergillus recurvatus]